jgi:antagonist of KipI
MIEVQTPGLSTTIQDLGRPGWRHLGVSAAGAADRDALRVANRLVGNEDGAAALELTLTGPTMRFREPALIALSGGDLDANCEGVTLPGWRPIAIAAGSTVRLARVTRGARAYLAVRGGFDVAPVLGSRSTDERGGFGGLAGRALAAGDTLRTRREAVHAGEGLLRRLYERDLPALVASWWVAPTDDLRGQVALLHLLPGEDVGVLEPRVLRTLREGVWRVATDSDRMGVRFDGPQLPAAPPAERVSSGVIPGTVQLPPDGRPIVLGVDAQTVGGYACVGNVIRADLGRLMQLRPGESVRPVVVTPEAAAAVLDVRRRELARQALAIGAQLAALDRR